MMKTKEQLLYRASLAEELRRYYDMYETMKKVIMLSNPIATSELDLLAVAWKEVMFEKRKSWKVLKGLQANAPPASKSSVLQEVLSAVEDEIKYLCGEMRFFVEKRAGALARGAEQRVYVRILTGDVYRYLAEISGDEPRKYYILRANSAYKGGYAIAAAKLKPGNEMRIAIAINYSTFIYDLLGMPEKGIKVARAAVASAKYAGKKTDAPGCEMFKILVENLRKWTEL